MTAQPNVPDLAVLLERMQVASRHMGLAPSLAEELISDLTFQWCRRGWDDVPFPDPRKLDAWVRRCLNRWLKTKLGRDAARYRVEKEFARRASSRQRLTSQDYVNAQELVSLIVRFVRQEGTPRAYRIVLLKLKGWAVPEIAKTLGTSPSTVRQELARLRKLLRWKLAEAEFLI
jgi:DNA-directed RNA polymerase specialized sigma24 family protein